MPLLLLAEGLSRVGFIGWFAQAVCQHVAGFVPLTALLLLLMVFYFSYYAFASIMAHVTAMLPVLLAVPWVLVVGAKTFLAGM
ncbi:anion permease [Telmatobacter bradus]|uniref:anion permease n=1 Tax=Telmatobacter bradus TaxID=474953 RepID=UPI003B43D2B1